MTGVRFVVETSFDIPGRGGLLVSGAVTGGSISAGDILRGPRAIGARRVLSVEFASPESRRHGRVTLVLDGPRDPIPAGAVLEPG